MKKRKQHPPEKKAEMVIRVLKEEETLAQIASQYGVHPNQLAKWKQQFLKDAPIIFKNDHKPLKDLKMKYDKELEVLYGEIGRLTTQLNWLKKKSGITLEQS